MFLLPADMASFIAKLEKLWAEDKFLCIGLDPDYEKLPKSIKGNTTDRIFKFNKAIIDATANLVCAYKPQIAHYEEQGVNGWKALEKTANYLHKNYPQIPVIIDAKRADIGSTNTSYAKAFFDQMGFDAITVNPYFGKEALKSFLDYKDKGIIILVRTSNPGAGEFQDIKNKKGEPLYLTVAKNVSRNWNKNGNCCIVVGATYPKELAQIRRIVGDMPILIPGIGAQGGDIEKTVKAGRDSKNQGIIIHSSRSIIFASSGTDFADVAGQKAKELSDQINQARMTKKARQLKTSRSITTSLTRKEKELADNLLEIGAFKLGDFKLKLHKEHPNAPLSPVYIDLRLLRRYPRAKKIAIDVYQELMKGIKFDLLADVPTAGSPFASSLSDRLKIGMITPRIDKKGHGSGARIDGLGPKDKGKTVLLIDDLITTSASKLEAANFMKFHGMKVKDVLVLIDREQGGEAQLKKNKIKLHFSLTLDRLLDYYLSAEKISHKKYDEIHERINDLNNYLKN